MNSIVLQLKYDMESLTSFTLPLDTMEIVIELRRYDIYVHTFVHMYDIIVEITQAIRLAKKYKSTNINNYLSKQYSTRESSKKERSIRISSP